MRIISQDGTIDVPYEISSLSMAVGKYENVEHAAIFCHNSSTAMGIKMAEYGSKEKAKKAMEMLREAWINETVEFEYGICHRNIILRFPVEEELE